MKTLIVGNFGFESENIGGQTIKTRNILELYKIKRGPSDVEYFDVEILYNQKTKLFDLFKLVVKSKEIAIIPGRSFLKSSIFSLILFFAKFGKSKIFVFAVGGWLSDFLSENVHILKLLKKVDAIFVESEFLKMGLEVRNGLSRIVKFPNFRISNFEKCVQVDCDYFRIVFMARVTSSKGCDMLFDVMDYFSRNKEEIERELLLDFYGPIDKNYESAFFSKLEHFENVNYKGVVQPNDVFDTLSRYDICILPTKYEGEGFPGTIIDSYIAGVPVIVSKWKNLPEFVEQNISGFIFDLDNFKSLIDSIKLCVNDKNVLEKLKEGASKKRLEYSPENAWKIIEKWSR